MQLYVTARGCWREGRGCCTKSRWWWWWWWLGGGVEDRGGKGRVGDGWKQGSSPGWKQRPQHRHGLSSSGEGPGVSRWTGRIRVGCWPLRAAAVVPVNTLPLSLFLPRGDRCQVPPTAFADIACKHPYRIASQAICVPPVPASLQGDRYQDPPALDRMLAQRATAIPISDKPFRPTNPAANA